MCVTPPSSQTGENKPLRYLKIPPLLVDGDDELINVGNQLIALGLPESVCTLFQELHEHVLIKEEGPRPGKSVTGKLALCSLQNT